MRKHSAAKNSDLSLFLAGDVMTGRGIDQVLPHSVDPQLYESYVNNALRYLQLAEQKNGRFPDTVTYQYIWGDALSILEQQQPDVRIINLETSVTTSDKYWQEKTIHYRMHPQNTPLLSTAGIDICVLGNNHVLDWGYPGLEETIQSLIDSGLQTSGAGFDLYSATSPAVKEIDSGRLLVFSYGSPTAGVPMSWQAKPSKPGLNVLTNLDVQRAEKVISDIREFREEGDRVIASLHWGSNWGYDIPTRQQEFAHRLINSGTVDLVHGHSSHHRKGIEVYKDKPIFYGCGDLINDYEGISGHEKYRDHLSLIYFPTLDSEGKLTNLQMYPMEIRRFQLHHASEEDACWLGQIMQRQCQQFGHSVSLNAQGYLELKWDD